MLRMTQKFILHGELIDTLVCYMAFRRQVVQGSSSWQRAGALAENLAEKGA